MRLLEVPWVYGLWQAPFASKKFAPFLARQANRALGRVLDVGCGPGTNAAVFRNCDYTGVDINPDYIQSASRRYPGLRFLVQDVTRLDVRESESFDCIVVNSLLHHIADPGAESLLEALSRLLSPEGKVYVIDMVLPERRSLARSLALADRGTAVRSLEELERLLATAFSIDYRELYSLRLAGLPLWQMAYFECRSE